MIFSGTKHNFQHYKIKIHNTDLSPVDSVKFLGVYLSYNLNWQKHIDHLITKSTTALNFIKIIAKESWAKNTKFLIYLVKTLVRSRLMYGMEAFHSLSKMQLRKLSQIETRALKSALGIPIMAVNKLVYRDIDWLPLKYLMKLNCAKFLVRLNATDILSQTEYLSTFSSCYQLSAEQFNKLSERGKQKFTHIYEFTSDLFQKSNFQIIDVVPYMKYNIPSWEWEPPYLDTSLTKYSKEKELNVLTVAAKEKIYNNRHQLQIFTDGSKLTAKNIGSAFVIPDMRITKSYKLNQNISIFTAELWAILKALDFINDCPKSITSVIIFTDSLSSIQALQIPGTSRTELIYEILFLIHQIHLKNTHVTVAWIPSHCGIHGNEVVDHAAKKAGESQDAPITNLGLSLNEGINLLKQAIHEIWHNELTCYCNDHVWDPRPVKKGLFLQVPYHLSSLIFRLRTEAYYCKYREQYCKCKQVLKLMHIFEGCIYIHHEFSKIIQDLKEQKKSFDYETIFMPENQDWSMLIQFAQTLMTCSVGYLF